MYRYLRENILPLQFESVSIQFNIVFDLTFFIFLKVYKKVEEERRERGERGEMVSMVRKRKILDPLAICKYFSCL